MYNDKPTPEYVAKFAERMRTEWSQQMTVVDKSAFDLYLKMDQIDVYEPERDAGLVKIKPIRTGYAGILIDRDAAALAGALAITVSPQDMLDPDNVAHANGLLEPWLNGVWNKSQIGEVFYPQVRDLALLNRGWSNFSILPSLWADGHFKDLVEELVEATEKNVKKGSEELRAQIKELEQEISAYKRDNFPLRWRYSDAKITFFQPSDERRLPEVIELREMKAAQIEAEYGEEKIPGSRRKDGDSAKIPIYVYSNWNWTLVVAGNEEDAKPLQEFEHGAGMSPYLLMECNALPDNERGVRWWPRLLHYKDSMETENELLSSYRHMVRREAETPLVVKFDSRRFEQDPKLAGNLTDIPIYANDGSIRLTEKESLEAGPVNQLNPDALKLLQFVHEENMQLALSPVLRGELLSGTAAVAFDVAKNQAKAPLTPYKRAIERAMTEWGRLAFRYVERINKEFPDVPDPIVVVDEGKGEIAVKPKDSKGWESYIVCRVGETGPTSENQAMDLAVKASNLPIPPDEILAKYLGFENAGEIIKRFDQYKIRQALMELVQQKIMEHAGELAQTTASPDVANLAAELQGLPPEVMLAMGQNGYPPEAAVMGQTIANENRAGVGQQMSPVPTGQGIPGGMPLG